MAEKNKCKFIDCLRCSQSKKELAELMSEQNPTVLSGIQVCLDTGKTVDLSMGSSVIFNKVLFNSNMEYDYTKGTITVNKKGTYIINWKLIFNTEKGSFETSITVNGESVVKTVTPNEVSNGGFSVACTGFALLSLNEGDKLQLINSNNHKITLSDVAIQAELMIVGLS